MTLVLDISIKYLLSIAFLFARLAEKYSTALRGWSEYTYLGYKFLAAPQGIQAFIGRQY